MKTKHSANVHPKRNPADAPDSLLPFARNAAVSLLITLGVSLGLLVLFSLAAYFTPDPDSLTAPLGLAAAALGSFFGGMIAVRVHHRRAPLPAALCNALLLSALMLVVSLFFAPLASGYSAPVCTALHAAVFAFSALGALAAARQPKPKKKKWG